MYSETNETIDKLSYNNDAMNNVKIKLNFVDGLRERNYPAFFCLMLASAPIGKKLETLWGLATEVRAIPLLVSNPLMGFMRLAAWRDQLQLMGLSVVEPWLNSYEMFFDDRFTVKESWQSLISSEALLMRYSVILLDRDASEDILKHAYNLGLSLGIIYLLQNDYKFGFLADQNLKQEMCKLLKDILLELNSLKLTSKSCKCVFYLLGYCELWFRNYQQQHHPITLSEGRIQWAVLKQKYKIWQKSLFLV